MKYLIYGDNLHLVSKAFSNLLTSIKAKNPQADLIWFDAEKDNLNDWSHITNPSLFDGHKIIKITHVHRP
ncbi:MAG: hypothetical protein GXP43_02815 [bacterium]|nr:hypothetical protein [bacterium]